MNLGIVGQAAGLFAVTNIDDILILSLFFAQGAGRHGSVRRIVIGQYLGFAAILAVAIAAAFGATFLPESAVPYLGLLEVAAVTFANGGDNIGVYVPVFATARVGSMSVYAIVFLILVAVWCFGGRFFATRPIIAKALSRWGHILLPLVLIAFGL
ncbi:cadmium resistance transporter [Streptomyces griseorubiginosus]|uniref:cadmium resistance transporter n=1 Tax=Streptomyces griseorubiginosus TaxID=67304 RepID=UPI003331C37A